MIDSSGRYPPLLLFHARLSFFMFESGVRGGNRGSPIAAAACGFRGWLPSVGRRVRPEDDQTASALSVMTI